MKDISPQILRSEDKFIAEGWRNGSPGFKQSLEMCLGRLLKTKGGLPTIATMRMAPRQ